VDSKQKETIIKLQKLNPNSIEFYDVATRYFSRRCRSNRNCGLISNFFALLGIVVIIFSPPNWFTDISSVLAILFFGSIGWGVFRIGHTQLVLIKTSRKAGSKYQKDALYFFCERDYCSQPVGGFILRQLGEDAHAKLHPLSIKGRKRDQIFIRN
jgi:hypothetical protein